MSKENLIDKVLEKELENFKPSFKIMNPNFNYLAEIIEPMLEQLWSKQKPQLFNFIKQTLQKELQKIVEDVIGEIENYFKNLVVIPDPQATGKNIKKKLTTYFQSIGVEIK